MSWYEDDWRGEGEVSRDSKTWHYRIVVTEALGCFHTLTRQGDRQAKAREADQTPRGPESQ